MARRVEACDSRELTNHKDIHGGIGGDQEGGAVFDGVILPA